MPMRARVQHLQRHVHKQVVVGRRAAWIARLAGKKIGDALPLRVRQFIPLRHPLRPRQTSRDAMNQSSAASKTLNVDRT